jgi:hypothetical protein
VSSFPLPHPSAMMFCLTMAKAVQPANHGLKPLQPGTKINSSSLKLFVSDVLSQ